MRPSNNGKTAERARIAAQAKAYLDAGGSVTEAVSAPVSNRRRSRAEVLRAVKRRTWRDEV